MNLYETLMNLNYPIISFYLDCLYLKCVVLPSVIRCICHELLKIWIQRIFGNYTRFLSFVLDPDPLEKRICWIRIPFPFATGIRGSPSGHWRTGVMTMTLLPLWGRWLISPWNYASKDGMVYRSSHNSTNTSPPWPSHHHPRLSPFPRPDGK